MRRKSCSLGKIRSTYFIIFMVTSVEPMTRITAPMPKAILVRSDIGFRLLF